MALAVVGVAVASRTSKEQVGLGRAARTDVALALLAALYSVVTIVLARVVFRERISRLQQLGVAWALAGVALIAGS